MGRAYDGFQVGERIEHVERIAITQQANEAFCALTRNRQPLHLDREAAQAAGFRDHLVNGLLTFSTAVGVTVPELTQGTLIANLGYDDVRHPRPVYPGDELRVESEVVEMRPSSKPGRGIVTFHSRVMNQDGDEVCTFRRAALLRMEDHA